MIDIARFTEEVRDNREAALALVGTNSLIRTYRDALRIVCDESAWRGQPVFAPAPRTAVDLRGELECAAARCGMQGASRKQIEFMMSLAAAKGDFAEIGCTFLTKGAASRLIDFMRQ